MHGVWARIGVRPARRCISAARGSGDDGLGFVRGRDGGRCARGRR